MMFWVFFCMGLDCVVCCGVWVVCIGSMSGAAYGFIDSW